MSGWITSGAGIASLFFSSAVVAIQESLDGKVVEWMETVTDEQTLAGPRNE